MQRLEQLALEQLALEQLALEQLALLALPRFTVELAFVAPRLEPSDDLRDDIAPQNGFRTSKSSLILPSGSGTCSSTLGCLRVRSRIVSGLARSAITGPRLSSLARLSARVNVPPPSFR